MHSCCTLKQKGAIMVRAFAHCAMSPRIDPSCGPIELFLVPSNAPRLV